MTEELMHYGILGMRWGVRRTPEQLGHRTKKRRKSKDAVAATEAKKKQIDELSTQELRDLAQRMQLEKQIKDLKRAQMNPGIRFVQDVLRETSKELLKEAIKGEIKDFAKTAGPAFSSAVKSKKKKPKYVNVDL